MNKNLEELNELNENDYKNLRLQDVVMYYIAPILEGFEKRIKGLEKHNLEYHEINETGGVTKIKLVGLAQAKKRKSRIAWQK